MAENESLKFQLQSVLDEKGRIENNNDHLKLENANLKIQKEEISSEILALRSTIEIQKNTLNELKEQNKIIKLKVEMAEFRHNPGGQSQQNKHHKSHRSKSGGKVEVSLNS